MPKEKDITIYDLASKLNISVATVSRALKDDPVVNKKTRNKQIDFGISKLEGARLIGNVKLLSQDCQDVSK